MKLLWSPHTEEQAQAIVLRAMIDCFALRQDVYSGDTMPTGNRLDRFNSACDGAQIKPISFFGRLAGYQIEARKFVQLFHAPKRYEAIAP